MRRPTSAERRRLLAFRTTVVTVVALLIACESEPPAGPATQADWPVTGGDPANDRYSPLTQITSKNVRRLQVTWRYDGGDTTGRGQIQATPIVVHGVLYSTTSSGRAFALRAATGERLWQFDPYATRPNEGSVNRGVVYWEDAADRRILFTAGSRLYALDASTGALKTTFGDAGSLDLSKGLGRDSANQSVVATSPGVVYHDLLIQGTRVGEGDGAAPGHVRAFDVRTGAVRWMFHTIPRPGEVGYETWPPDAWRSAGGANSWPGLALDVARGIVYVPTGSASPDFWGGDRIGANLFANSLLALDAATGRRLWHFQTVHHDILDRDLPAAPSLTTLVRNGKSVDVVAQIAKTGFVFVFDRTNGTPLFPIEEKPVPASDIPGDVAWPTQPIPAKPAPFARQQITDNDLTDVSPEAHAAVLARFRTLRNDGLFTPPSREGSIVFPGFDGGGEWGGAAVDRETGVLYVNASDVPWIAELVPQEDSMLAGRSKPRPGPVVYASACASCHGVNRQGDGSRSPSLVNLGNRLTPQQVRDILDRGRNFMPSFASLSVAERDAVTKYLSGRAPADIPHSAASATASRAQPAPFRLRNYERWRDPAGLPAVKPPWGTLNAIDLNTGDYLWKIPLGDMPNVAHAGTASTGTEQYGGPIVTAGGVVFIAATLDEKFRAFDKKTGRLLWETSLPAAGYATPMTYMVDGRQFVVIAAGGGKLGTKSSDTYLAFALPR